MKATGQEKKSKKKKATGPRKQPDKGMSLSNLNNSLTLRFNVPHP